MYCVKKWAKQRQIQDTYRGYLSSYTYTLMVIQFLQFVRILPSLQEIGRDQVTYRLQFPMAPTAPPPRL